MAAPGIIKRLRQLTDVVWGAPNDGDVLTYDGGDSKAHWEPGTGGGGGGPPSGPAGGVLGGNYPNPTFAADQASQAELDAHMVDTSAVHGIADTTVLATDAEVAAAVAAHDADTSVHGIADTTALATDAELATHAADTSNVHGIANTLVLATDAEVAAAVAAHEADTTNVHGIANTTVLATDAELAAAIAASEAGQVRDGDAAGGDLTGTYPNPQLAANSVTAAEIANDAVGNTEIAAGAVDTAELANGSVTAAKVDSEANLIGDVLVADGAGGATWDAQAAAGPAGGVLSGTYPNPGFAEDMATQAELDAVAAAGVNDGDAAGGVLAGTYPNPSFAVDMATQAELDAVDAANDAALAAHLADTADAHDASAVSFAPVVTVVSTDAQAAIVEVEGHTPPPGGTPGQVLAKNSVFDYDTEWIDPPEGGGGSGEATVKDIAQVAHGLTVGDWVRLDSAGEYVLAQADTAENAEALGIVTAVADTDNFTLTRDGYVEAGLAGLTPGDVYYLDPDTPGEITATAPTAVGEVDKPMLVAETATTGWMRDLRGMVAQASDESELFLLDDRASNVLLVESDRGHILRYTAGGFTQDIEDAAVLGDGWWCVLWNVTAAAVVTLDGAGGDTIDDAVTRVLLPGETRMLLCDGSNFRTINITEAYPWVYVRKTADESVANSTTGQDDNELLFPTVAGAIYEVEACLLFNSPVGAGTPDLKVASGEDTGVRGQVSGWGLTTAEAVGGVTVLTNLTATLTFGTAAATRMARLTGQHYGNGGNFVIRWAQNTLNANNVTMLAGSFIRYRRVL